MNKASTPSKITGILRKYQVHCRPFRSPICWCAALGFAKIVLRASYYIFWRVGLLTAISAAVTLSFRSLTCPCTVCKKRQFHSCITGQRSAFFRVHRFGRPVERRLSCRGRVSINNASRTTRHHIHNIGTHHLCERCATMVYIPNEDTQYAIARLSPATLTT